MRAVVQRVKEARVVVDGRTVGSIGQGLLVFLGVEQADDKKDVDYLVSKIINLRIFKDSEHKFNLSLKDVKGHSWWFPSLLFLGIAGKAEDLPLRMRLYLIRHETCMTILSHRLLHRIFQWHRGSFRQRWMFTW